MQNAKCNLECKIILITSILQLYHVTFYRKGMSGGKKQKMEKGENAPGQVRRYIHGENKILKVI